MLEPQKQINLELFGFQAGPDGFVRYGLDPNEIDYLFLRVRAGRQAGKTTAGAMRSALFMSKYAGSAGMIISLTADKSRDTVIPTLFGVYKRMGMTYGTHYEYNKTERTITFLFNGSVAYLRSAEEPDNLPGPSLSWFWLDEDRKMPEKVFTLMQPTLTQVGYPHQAWLTSTPAGKAHWSRKIWLPKQYAKEFDIDIPERAAGTYRSYTAWTKDNPNLSPDYYKTLVSTYGGANTSLAKQELFGEEIIFEDLVFPVWDSTKHMKKPELWPTPLTKMKRVLAGVDFGFTNPCAVVVEGIDEQQRHYILDEFYQVHMSEQELARVLKAMRRQYGIKYFICDSADPRWLRALRAAGLPAIAAKKTIGSINDPSSGIGLCHATLSREMEDGTQGFYVRPKCINFKREIENYVREDSKDKLNPSEKPRKKNDHLLDAWRYAETAIQHFWGETNLTKARSARMKIE